MFILTLLAFTFGQATAEPATIEMNADGTAFNINAGDGKTVAVSPALTLGGIANVETTLSRAVQEGAALEERVHALTTDLQEIKLAKDALTADVNGKDAATKAVTDALAADLGDVNSAVERLSAEDDKHASVLESHGTKFGEHDTLLAAQAKSLKQCNADVEELQELVTVLNSTVALLNATWNAENGPTDCNLLGASEDSPSINCYSLHKECPKLETGLYWVTGNHADFESPKAFKVQCDMTYGGGGWTLVHRANNKDHSSSDRCAQRTLRGEGGCTKDDGNFGEVSTVALRKFGGLEMKHVGGFCAYDKDTINALRTPTETLGSDTAGMRLGLDGAASQCSVFRYFKSECRYTVGDNTNNMRNGDECAFFKMSASKDEVDKEANTLDDVTTWTSSSCSGTWSAPGIRSCNSNSDYSAYCERDNDLDKDSIRGCNRICIGMITYFDSNSCYDPWGFGRAQGKAGTFWVR
eukprot:gene13010-12061_t